jgi:hypothetical protein
MNITLYSCNDDKRKINKTLSNGVTGTATPVRPIDLINPEIILDNTLSMGWDALNHNYCYIDYFASYYFITDYTIDTAARIHLTLEVDPMFTMGNAIKNTTQHVIRAESIGKPTMITDSKYPVSPERDLKVILFDGGELGLSDATDYTLNYILNVAGGGGE